MPDTNLRRESQNRLYKNWLQQLERELMGTGRGYSWLDWDIYMKGLLIRPFLLQQDPTGYKPYFEEADKLVARSHSKNWAKRLFLDELKVEDLTEENMRTYLGQVQLHALHELDVLLLTPQAMGGLFDSMIRDPMGVAQQ